jgi:hypothetical protein
MSAGILIVIAFLASFLVIIQSYFKLVPRGYVKNAVEEKRSRYIDDSLISYDSGSPEIYFYRLYRIALLVLDEISRGSNVSIQRLLSICDGLAKKVNEIYAQIRVEFSSDIGFFRRDIIDGSIREGRDSPSRIDREFTELMNILPSIRPSLPLE